jgi:hypothetical protein
MTNLRYDNQTRTETDETVIATLVRKGWEVFTPEPVVEVPPAYTAAEWVEKHLTSIQLHALSDLRVSILLGGKTLGLKMTAMHNWTSQMIVAGVTAPDEKRSDYSVAPFSFEEASSEALQTLNS